MNKITGFDGYNEDGGNDDAKSMENLFNYQIPGSSGLLDQMLLKKS